MGRWLRTAAVAVAVALVTVALGRGAAAEEVKLEQRGVTYNANLEVPPGGDIRQGVVLIVHGTLADRGMEIVTSLQKGLGERGLATLAINLSLGVNDRHGPFDCAAPHLHSNEASVEEIVLWTGWLKERDVNRIVLLGHSRGGAQVAWYQAQWRDPAVEGVALVAPVFWDPGAAARRYQDAFGEPLAPVVERARAMVMDGRGREMLDGVGFLHCQDARVMASTFLTYYDDNRRFNSPLVVQWLKREPILVVAGLADPLTTGLAPSMHKLLDQKKDILVEIADADHFFLDLHGEDMMDAVRGFVESIPR